MGVYKVYIPEKAPRFCVKCHARLSGDSPFCNNCGAIRYRCSCGEFLDWGMKFCPKCGNSNPAEIRRRRNEILRVLSFALTAFLLAFIAIFGACQGWEGF